MVYCRQMEACRPPYVTSGSPYLITHLSSTFYVASMRATITFELGSLIRSLSRASTRFTMTSSLRSSPRGRLLTPTLLSLSTTPPLGASPCARPPLLSWVACRHAFMFVCLSVVCLHVPSLPARPRGVRFVGGNHCWWKGGHGGGQGDAPWPSITCGSTGPSCSRVDLPYTFLRPSQLA